MKRMKIERISMTLPGETLQSLDQMAEVRGFDNRSQLITQLINKELTEYEQDAAKEVMTGTITLFYENGNGRLGSKLAGIQREHVAEVISSLHVQLERNHTMEVLVVQGPTRVLRELADKLMACRGVKTGKLNLTTILIPQVHAR